MQETKGVFMKCANCDSEALYLYNPRFLVPTAYCATHLPKFLTNAAKAGLLPVTETFEEVKKEALAILSPTSSAEESAPQAVEEPPAAPTPKKTRRTSKKADPTQVAEATVEEPAEDS